MLSVLAAGNIVLKKVIIALIAAQSWRWKMAELKIDFAKMAEGFIKTAKKKGMFVGWWIPVSERLPEINQRVLVTSYGRVCYAMMISADGNSGYPVFRLQDSLNERVICETTVHSEFTTSRITAWMPLPQPYKAESEDEE